MHPLSYFPHIDQLAVDSPEELTSYLNNMSRCGMDRQEMEISGISQIPFFLICVIEEGESCRNNSDMCDFLVPINSLEDSMNTYCCHYEVSRSCIGPPI